MSTDTEWVKWGQQDPYFAVITEDRFRAGKLNDDAKQAFFDTGRWHARYVLDTCRRLIDPAFEPARALDFGCGVGRVAVPLAERVASVVGVDVSPDMLAEARRNCDLHGLANVELLPSDDTLSAVIGSFDLVHSCITFQHIDVPRGRRLFARLIELLAHNGIGAIQITYAKAYHPDSHGQPPAPPPPPGAHHQDRRPSPGLDTCGAGRAPRTAGRPRNADEPLQPERAGVHVANRRSEIVQHRVHRPRRRTGRVFVFQEAYSLSF